jgi:glyoxylase-like metal-dependent hydrolase (beta-lactamase superfamily II)
MHTPGHTHHHVGYVLADADGSVQAVFTGGSMLYGATVAPTCSAPSTPTP